MDPCMASITPGNDDPIHQSRCVNLWQWSKEVFFGFETRVLDGRTDSPSGSGPSDDEDWPGSRFSELIITCALNHTIRCRDRRRSWTHCVKGLRKFWVVYGYAGNIDANDDVSEASDDSGDSDDLDDSD